MSAATQDQTAKKIQKQLRKKPQTLGEIADKIGVSVKGLAVPAGRLVRDGLAIKHEGRPNRYSKP